MPTPAPSGADPDPEMGRGPSHAAQQAGLLTELPSRPAVKKPRLPQGARIVSRTLNTARHRPHRNLTRADQHLAPRRRIDIGRTTSLVSVLKRVQKLLDKSPRGVMSQGLLDVSHGGGGGGNQRKAGAKGGAGRVLGGGGAGSGNRGPVGGDGDVVVVGGERFDVLVVGTGPRNIEKALNTAAVFQRRGDCVVRLYTNTVSGIDTYEVDEEEGQGSDDDGHGPDAGHEAAMAVDSPEHDAHGEKKPEAHGKRAVGRTLKQRGRKASSLEVAIRLQ